MEMWTVVVIWIKFTDCAQEELGHEGLKQIPNKTVKIANHIRVGHWILSVSQFCDEMGNDFKQLLILFRSSLVFPQKNPYLSLQDAKTSLSFRITYPL